MFDTNADFGSQTDTASGRVAPRRAASRRHELGTLVGRLSVPERTLAEPSRRSESKRSFAGKRGVNGERAGRSVDTLGVRLGKIVRK